MIIIKDKKIDAVHDTIRHGFFGKTGGVSQGVYESLNAAYGSKDDKKYVNENLKRIAESLGIVPDKLMNVWQVHSKDCVYVNSGMTLDEIREIKADAMVTDKPNVGLGALSADCTPILFSGLKADGAPVIGAAHSGWGGSLKGIGEATVDKMLALGARLDTIQAAIGPCIGPKSYEVSIGFEEPFLDRAPEDEHFFRESQRDGHLMFDMPGYVASRLAQHGVKNVTITGHDTYALEQDFFSYRRTTHNNEPDYCRQISVIAIVI